MSKDNAFIDPADLIPDPPYIPSPEGARLMAVLIETGYLPIPLPEGIPPHWMLALFAVDDVATQVGGFEETHGEACSAEPNSFSPVAQQRTARFQAYLDAMQENPCGVQMQEEVQSILNTSIDQSLPSSAPPSNSQFEIQHSEFKNSPPTPALWERACPEPAASGDEGEGLNPAQVLALLIHRGLATVLPDSLPPEWCVGYEAVLTLPECNFRDRLEAFEHALANDPACHIMVAEIENAQSDLENPPPGQERIYAAWETLHFQAPVSDPIVAGLFNRSSLNLLVGAPGTKKTWLALDLAVSVASGQSWLGHGVGEGATNASPAQDEGDEPSPQPGSNSQFEIRNSQFEISFSPKTHSSKKAGAPVLILDAEGGLQRIWDRLARTMRGHAAAPDIPLHFIPPSFINFTRGDREVEYISGIANSLGAKLIIIDALVNVMGGTDENNLLSVQPIFDTLRKVARATGAAVVVIHHTNKQGLYRGSSFMSSSVDHMLLVESPPNDSVISIRTFKARDLAPVLITARAVFGPLPVESEGINSLPLSRGRVGDGVSTFKLELVDNKVQTKLGRASISIIDHLAKLGAASPAQLIESVPELKPSSFRSVIHDLIVLGFITRTDGGGRGSPARYCLTPDGSQLVKGEKINEPNPPPPTKTTTS